jgi:hypothetical protein
LSSILTQIFIRAILICKKFHYQAKLMGAELPPAGAFLRGFAPVDGLRPFVSRAGNLGPDIFLRWGIAA